MEFKQAFLISLNTEHYTGSIALESLCNFKYEESNIISTEGFVDVIKHIIEKIKEFFSKFINWIKITWPKMLIYITKIMSYFDTAFQNFNFIRNNYDITLSKETIDYWNEFYSCITQSPEYMEPIYQSASQSVDDLIDIIKAVTLGQNLHDYKPSSKVVSPYIKLINDSGKNENTTIMLVTYGLGSKVKYIGCDENGKLHYNDINLELSNKNSSKFYNHKLDISHLTESIKAVTSFRKKITDFLPKYNEVFRFTNAYLKKEEDILKNMNKHEGSSDLIDKQKIILNNLNILSTKAMTDVLYYIAHTASKLYKYVKLVVKDCSNQSLMGYEWISKAIMEKNDSVLQTLADLISVSVPHDLGIKLTSSDFYNTKVISDGKLAYLDVTGCTDNVRAFISVMGGAAAFPPDRSRSETDYSNISKHLKNDPDKEYTDMLRRILLSGFIIVDKKSMMESTLGEGNKVAGTNIGFKFLLYHELGHLVTNQFETPISRDPAIEDIVQNGTEEQKTEALNKHYADLYIKGMWENIADAYAIVNTSTSVDDIVKWRFAIFKVFGYPKHLYEGREEEMRTNIKKQIANLGSVAKMDLMAKIKSVYKSK